MFGKYGLVGSIRLVISYLYTKLRFSKARLIRFPFDIRNRKYIDLGLEMTTGYGCRIEAFPVKPTNEKILIFGNHIEMNDYVHIAAGEKITIGNNVLIASKVFISDINHGQYGNETPDNPETIPNKRKLSTKPVIIEDNVWLGEGVCIMAGITIGKGCIIGASSVVTKNIPPYSIAIGNPARVIKQFDSTLQKWIKTS